MSHRFRAFILEGPMNFALPAAVTKALEPLGQLAVHASNLIDSPISLHHASHEHRLPRYLFGGLPGGGDPIRIGIFAGIHGDEPASTSAMVQFAQSLIADPELGQGYRVFLYPICNPTGFADSTRHSRSGKDLNREFWKESIEPEVILLEKEIRSHHFHGLVSLHSDDTSHGMYGFVRGHVLARDLLEPALRAAERHLPRNTNPTIDGFAATNGIISECYDGILTSPPNLDPNPFEIILESPHAAPEQNQILALDAALRAILVEYRRFLAYAADL